MSLEVGQSISDAAHIRIVVVPVGDITQATFDKYRNFITSIDRVEISQFPPDSSTDKGVFQNRVWQHQHGQLKFAYVDADTPISQYQDFQAHRKVLAVVGICHCPRSTDLKEAHAEFLKICKDHENALATRLFAFEPLETQSTPDLPLRDLIVIPNQDDDKMRFNVMNLVSFMGESLLSAIEKEIKVADSAFSVVTPLDNVGGAEDRAEGAMAAVGVGSVTTAAMRMKKRRAGRISKVIGDYCLLACSPMDAITHFTSAVEQARSNGDNVWLAGALEGLACATLLAESTGAMTGRSSSEASLSEAGETPLKDKVFDLYQEALANYKKKSAIDLHVEAAIKLARFLVSQRAHSQALEMLSTAFHGSSSLTQQDKILAYGELARLCKRMGALRKFGFFVRQAAVLHHELCNDRVAFNLAIHAVPHFSLPLRISYPDDILEADTGMLRHKGWPALQLRLLKDLIEIAKSSGDVGTTVQLTVYLLCQLHSQIDPTVQHKILSDLAALVPYTPSHTIPTLTPLPILVSAEPVRLPLHLDPIVRGEGSGKGIFIYSPFEDRAAADKKKTRQIVWVEDCVSRVSVVLRNPFAFELCLNDINVMTEGCEFESYSGEIRLPPNSPQVPLVLFGKPKAQGSLTLTAISCRLSALPFAQPLVIPISAANQGSSSAQAPLPVSVVTSLPLLSLQASLFSSTSLSLYDGEMTEFSLVVENVGSKDIKYMNITLQGEKLDRGSLVAWDDSLVQQHLPLSPGQKFSLPLNIHARLMVNAPDDTPMGRTLSVDYGCVESARRRATLPLPLTVKKALALSSLSVDPRGFMNLDIANYATGAFLIKAQHSLAPGVPGAETHVPLMSHRSEEGMIACEPGSTTRLVLPFERFGVILENAPHKTLEKRYTEAYKAALIEKVSLHWVSHTHTRGTVWLNDSLNLTREVLEQLIPSHVVVSAKFYEYPMSSPAGSDTQSGTMPPDLSVKIENLSPLKPGVHGYEVSSGTPYLMQMNMKCQHPSKTVQISTQAPPKDNKKPPVETFVPFPSPLDVTLRVVPHQDGEGGSIVTDLSHKFVHSGALSRDFPLVKDQEEQQHSVLLWFLSPGAFKLSLACTLTGTDKTLFQLPAPVVLHVHNGM